jgi:N-acetylglucosaminyldiphosphoundecaprenol N-acetyl-beta-D-mannosaminyltransferase
MLTANKHSQIEAIELLGIRIHLITEVMLNEYIAHVIHSKRRSLILNVNVHCYNEVYSNSWLRDFLNHSDLTFCDGSGVLLGAKLFGYQIPERITYADWMWNLAQLAEQHGFTFFFLGAKPGVAEQAAEKLLTRFPQLKITTQHGYFDKTSDSAENKQVIARINAAQPNILIVGFGMPVQEQWLRDNWAKLDANIALTGGAVFDYISGELQRGPRWMTDNHLEWLARLLIEPKRLWRRYTVENVFFLYLLLKERFSSKN